MLQLLLLSKVSLVPGNTFHKLKGVSRDVAVTWFDFHMLDL